MTVNYRNQTENGQVPWATVDAVVGPGETGAAVIPNVFAYPGVEMVDSYSARIRITGSHTSTPSLKFALRNSATMPAVPQGYQVLDSQFIHPVTAMVPALTSKGAVGEWVIKIPPSASILNGATPTSKVSLLLTATTGTGESTGTALVSMSGAEGHATPILNAENTYSRSTRAEFPLGQTSPALRIEISRVKSYTIGISPTPPSSTTPETAIEMNWGEGGLRAQYRPAKGFSASQWVDVPKEWIRSASVNSQAKITGDYAVRIDMKDGNEFRLCAPDPIGSFTSANVRLSFAASLSLSLGYMSIPLYPGTMTYVIPSEPSVTYTRETVRPLQVASESSSATLNDTDTTSDYAADDPPVVDPETGASDHNFPPGGNTGTNSNGTAKATPGKTEPG